MCPDTFGAIPTKLARTVASSVSGKFSHRQMVTTMAIKAPTMMSAPRARASARRRADGTSSGSIAGSATEHTPEDEGDEDREGGIDEDARSEVGVEAGPREELPAEHGREDADHEGEHPRGKVRACHGDVCTPPAAGQNDADRGHPRPAKPRSGPANVEFAHKANGRWAGAGPTRSRPC